MYGRPQVVVVWVNPRAQRGKQLGGLAFGPAPTQPGADSA